MSTTPSSYVPGLDGLRAIAVNTVIIGHLGFSSLVPGGLGVTTFFFISGYLISLLLWQEHERFGRIDMPRFYGRRMLRLFPELVVFLAVVGLVMGPLINQPLPPLQALAGLTYWMNYFTIFDLGHGCQSCAVTGHLWSLAVEEHFYLLMPMALIATAFVPKRMATLFLAVIVLSLIWRTVAVFVFGWPETYTYQSTETRIDSIAWGCLAAVLQQARPQLMDTMKRFAWPVLASGLALLAFTIVWRDAAFRETLRYSLQGVALGLVILPLINAAPMGWMVKILEWPVFRWMGRRSYGAYLWHMAAITLVGLAFGVAGPVEQASRGAQLLVLPFAFPLAWLMAELSYRLIFMPAQRLKPLVIPRAPAPPLARPQEA